MTEDEKCTWCSTLGTVWGRLAAVSPCHLDLAVADFPSWFRQNSLCSQKLQGLRVRHMPFPTLLFQGGLSWFPSLPPPPCHFWSVYKDACHSAEWQTVARLPQPLWRAQAAIQGTFQYFLCARSQVQHKGRYRIIRGSTKLLPNSSFGPESEETCLSHVPVSWVY